MTDIQGLDVQVAALPPTRGQAQAVGVVVGRAKGEHGEGGVRSLGTEQAVGDLVESTIPAGGADDV